MKKYEAPKIEITNFGTDDIVTTSFGGDYKSSVSLPVFFEQPDKE